MTVMEKKHWELHKLREAIEKEVSWKPAKMPALKRVVGYLQGKEKPKKETLDKLALFVGFQNWDSFREALHGEADASLNYEEESKEKGNKEHESKEKK